MNLFTFKAILIYIFIAYATPFIIFYIYFEKYNKITAELKYKYPVYDDSDVKKNNFYLTHEKPKNWIEIGLISEYTLDAVVVSEDWAFYSHKGFDLFQISLIFKEFFEKGKFSRGASTITQQLAKNIYLSPERTLMRKLKEFIIALSLENNLNKDRILEIYFNIVSWGLDIRGIKAASNHYFFKDPYQINLLESTFLAMLLPSPVRYSELFKKDDKEVIEFAMKTMHQILGKLLFAKKITEEEYRRAVSEKLQMHKNILRRIAKKKEVEETGEIEDSVEPMPEEEESTPTSKPEEDVLPPGMDVREEEVESFHEEEKEVLE